MMDVILPISRPLAVTRCIAVFIHLDPDIARSRRRLCIADLPEIYTHGAFDSRQSSIHPLLTHIHIYTCLCAKHPQTRTSAHCRGGTR